MVEPLNFRLFQVMLVSVPKIRIFRNVIVIKIVGLCHYDISKGSPMDSPFGRSMILLNVTVPFIPLGWGTATRD